MHRDSPFDPGWSCWPALRMPHCSGSPDAGASARTESAHSMSCPSTHRPHPTPLSFHIAQNAALDAEAIPQPSRAPWASQHRHVSHAPPPIRRANSTPCGCRACQRIMPRPKPRAGHPINHTTRQLLPPRRLHWKGERRESPCPSRDVQHAAPPIPRANRAGSSTLCRLLR